MLHRYRPSRVLTFRIVASPIVLALALMGAAAPAAEFETPTAIVNVTVVPQPGQLIEEATILIDKGRIRAVGRSVSIPPEAEVIDATGLWAYAGFIDALSHAGIDDSLPGEEEMARLADEEQDAGQGPRTHMQKANRKGIWPHRTVGDVYVADDAKMEAYRKAGFTAALLSPYPAILGGKGDFVNLSGASLRASVIGPGITQIVAYGGTAMRQGRGLYPGSRLGAVALLRQTYMDGEWYNRRKALYQSHPNEARRAPSDPVLEAMGRLINRKETWTFLANTASEIHHALDLADEFNQNVIILGGKEAWKVAARLAAERVSVIVSPDWEEKPKLRPKKKKESDDTRLLTTVSWEKEWEDAFFEPLAMREERVRLWEDRVNNLKALIDAGIDVAITGRDTSKTSDLWKNLRTAVEHGLTAEELLAVLTTSPAAILGVEDQVGAVAPGRLANLAIMTKPLEDKDAKVRYTFVEGERFDFAVTLKAEDSDSDDEEDNDSEDSEDEDGEDDDGDEEEGEEDSGEAVDLHPWKIETDADREKPIDTGGDVLLKNATVLTVTNGTLPDTDVLVTRGRIQEIGQNIAAPEGITELDLTGYYIMPGIIDPHSHMGTRAINEGASSITVEVRIADVTDHTSLSLQRALAGGVTTIHTMHGSANSMGGQNAVQKLRYNTSPGEMLVTSGPRIVKFALGENVTRSRGIPRFPNTRMGVESVMRQAFNEALEYRKEWQRYANAQAEGVVVDIPRRDLRLEALSDIMRGNIWVHSHCYRADEILRLLAVAKDYGFRVATLQHVLEGYRVAPEMFAHGVAGSTFSDWWGYKKEAYDAIPYNAAMMVKEGIITSVNSDSANTVRYLNLEAAKTMRYGGLTADEAIRLATINPAIQIGLDNRIGSIEVGKDGDFAVFNGHPLDTFSKNVMTLIEGEVFFAHPDLDLENIKPGPGSEFIPEPPRGLMSIPNDSKGVYVIAGATVHPVSSAPIENGTVVIENGRIAAVGSSLALPAGATRIDASGLHVYPGLINAVTRIGITEIGSQSETQDFREIATLQPEIRSVSAVNAHSEHVGVALCEGITTVGVFPSGGLISGVGGLIQLGGWSMPEMLRDGELGLVINLPSLPANLSGDSRKRRVESHQAAIESIEKFILKARRYADVKEAGVDVVMDIRLDAMAPYVNGEKPVFFNANSYKQILEAVNFAKSFGLKPIVVGGADAWKCADMLAEEEVPVIVTAVYRTPNSRFDPFDAYYGNPATLEAAGVDFCIATGGDSQSARRLNVNAGMAVAHGLSPGRAVRSITLDAARILGVAEEVGSLEPGKVADIIITTGHPARANTRTVGMFLKGEPTELTSRHERSYQKWSNRPAPNLPRTHGLRGPEPMRIP